MRFFINWMLLTLLAVAFFAGLFAVSYAAERWSPWTVPEPTSTTMATATAVPTVMTATATMAATPIPPTATQKPPTPTSEPQPVTEGGNSAALPLPPDTRTVLGGCASDGACYWYNFYWAPTQEVVMQYGEGVIKVQHEICHAHQHWSINGGAPLLPSDYDLGSWYETTEAQSFITATAGLSWPWTHSAINSLEDFAWTCAYWYLDPEQLVTIGGQERYEWARRNLP